MRARRGRVVAAMLAASVCFGLLVSCGDKSAAATLESLRATQSRKEAENPKSIDELKRGIRDYEKEADRTVKATENLGTYYRLLGVEYMNRAMYGEALASFEQAIRIYPDNEQLTYYAGLCAARAAKGQVDDAEKARLFGLAEKYYTRTLYLFPDHRPALFGLAVLYSMELNKPAAAVPLLERYLAKDASNVEAMTLLARSHVALGNYEEARSLYEKVSRSGTAGEDVKKQARENADSMDRLILGGGTKP